MKFCAENEIKKFDLDTRRKEIEARYLDRLATDLRSFKALDLPQVRDLGAHYVELRLRELDVIPLHDVKEEIQLGVHPRILGQKSEGDRTFNVSDLLEKMSAIAIIGDPGAGKTTLLTFYELRSHGQNIIFVGDIIHCAAVQLPDPKVTITYDVDSVKAAAVRRDALASFTKDRTLIAVPHLPFPGVGHIKPSGKGYEWVPALYENRDFASGATFQDPHKNGDRLDPGPAQCGSLESKNKALVLEAIDTLFHKQDYAAAERFWSPGYIQHSAHVAPGREGLFNLVKSLPPTAKYESGTIVAEGDFIIVHGRVSRLGQPVNWIVADILRIKDGVLVEHWDVIEDEATQEQSKSGRPMFGDSFPR